MATRRWFKLPDDVDPGAPLSEVAINVALPSRMLPGGIIESRTGSIKLKPSQHDPRTVSTADAPVAAALLEAGYIEVERVLPKPSGSSGDVPPAAHGVDRSDDADEQPVSVPGADLGDEQHDERLEHDDEHDEHDEHDDHEPEVVPAADGADDDTKRGE